MVKPHMKPKEILQSQYELSRVSMQGERERGVGGGWGYPPTRSFYFGYLFLDF